MSGPYAFQRWIGVALIVGALLVFATAAAWDAWDRAKRADRVECRCPACRGQR